MTTPSDALSLESAQEQHAMGRPFRILFRVLLLPGIIVVFIAVLSGVFAAFSGASPDRYAYLSPLVRLGWGLLALGLVLFMPLARVLRWLNPRLNAYAHASVLRRYRHPRWAIFAAIWTRLVLAAMPAALALAPRDLVISWLTLIDPTTEARYSDLVLIGTVLVGGIIALAPTLALREFDRPR